MGARPGGRPRRGPLPSRRPAPGRSRLRRRGRRTNRPTSRAPRGAPARPRRAAPRSRRARSCRGRAPPSAHHPVAIGGVGAHHPVAHPASEADDGAPHGSQPQLAEEPADRRAGDRLGQREAEDRRRRHDRGRQGPGGEQRRQGVPKYGASTSAPSSWGAWARPITATTSRSDRMASKSTHATPQVASAHTKNEAANSSAWTSRLAAKRRGETRTAKSATLWPMAYDRPAPNSTQVPTGGRSAPASSSAVNTLRSRVNAPRTRSSVELISGLLSGGGRAATRRASAAGGRRGTTRPPGTW
jgi:hypothetical protein